MLQAAATGLPLVAADAVALPELVDDGVNGFLVPPGDPQVMVEAMARILDDCALAAGMGQESLSIARAHAESRTFDLYEDLYRRTLQIVGKN
jgi:glycosyltransferase involved in cell wall biosynthesis